MLLCIYKYVYIYIYTYIFIHTSTYVYTYVHKYLSFLETSRITVKVSFISCTAWNAKCESYITRPIHAKHIVLYCMSVFFINCATWHCNMACKVWVITCTKYVTHTIHGTRTSRVTNTKESSPHVETFLYQFTVIESFHSHDLYVCVKNDSCVCAYHTTGVCAYKSTRTCTTFMCAVPNGPHTHISPLTFRMWMGHVPRVMEVCHTYGWVVSSRNFRQCAQNMMHST